MTDPKKILTDFHLWAEGSDVESDLYHTGSHMLYQAYLNAFKLRMTQEKYDAVKGYQENLFDLIDALRDTDSNTLKLFLEFTDKENPYLADLILICWCLPRSDDYLSMQTYQRKYRENISRYNKIVLDIVDHFVIKNFCIETLTKTNNVPIHCIDYIWYYVNNAISLEFYFVNSNHQGYLSVRYHENHHENHHENDQEIKSKSKKNHTKTPEILNVTIGLDMEYLLGLGLGLVDYNGKKPLFKNVIKNMITDKDMIETFSQSYTKENYLKQKDLLIKNPQKYFREELATEKN